MKKLLLIGVLFVGFLSTTLAYTPTTTDDAVIERLSQKIEEKIEEKGESFRWTVLELLENLQRQANNERYNYIFGGIFDNIENNMYTNIIGAEAIALGTNQELKLNIGKGWTEQFETGFIRADNTWGYYMPLEIQIKNISDKKLLLPTPGVEFDSSYSVYVEQPSSFVVACEDAGNNTLGFYQRTFEQSIFISYPSILNQEKINGYQVQNISNRNNNEIGVNGQISVINTNGRAPRLTYANEEKVEGEFTLNCSLFVNTMAGELCEINQPCYANLVNNNDYAYLSDFNNPSQYWKKIDEANLTISYIGEATSCDFGCDRNYTFWVNE